MLVMTGYSLNIDSIVSNSDESVSIVVVKDRLSVFVILILIYFVNSCVFSEVCDTSYLKQIRKNFGRVGSRFVWL